MVEPGLTLTVGSFDRDEQVGDGVKDCCALLSDPSVAHQVIPFKEKRFLT
jgi:hypothetical protein